MGLSQANATTRSVICCMGWSAAALVMCWVGAARAQCVGDCANNGEVTINELILGVSIALGSQDPSACPALRTSRGRSSRATDQGVNNALDGCPAAATATATEPIGATGTATAVPTGTATVQPTATATVVSDSTPTETSTSPATATVTRTPFPIGDAVAGNVNLVTAGVGAVPSIISAVIAQVTNKGPGLTEVVVTNGLPSVDDCPISGTTSQLCTEMGSSSARSIHLELGADFCTAAGPAGGSAQFDGSIIVDSGYAQFPVNNCDPLRSSTAPTARPT